MSRNTTIDPDAFLQTVRTVLENGDMPTLLSTLKENWTPVEIASLLSCRECDVRKVAAFALALVGDRTLIPALVQQLRDSDPMLNEMAEHALWSIWFRASSAEASRMLAAGARALGQRDFSTAERMFDGALAMDPHFAEAWNQKAILHYLREEYAQSIAACRKAIALMPEHFGAWAGMGHCNAQLGNAREAIFCYGRALEINPHLQCIAEAVRELKRGSGTASKGDC